MTLAQAPIDVNKLYTQMQIGRAMPQFADRLKLTPEAAANISGEQTNKGLAGTVFDPVYGSGFKAGQGSVKPPETSWWGENGYLSTAGTVLSGLGSLANAYTGWKGLGLAEDQFEFEKGLASTNLANQAGLINTQMSNATDVGLSLAGGTLTEAQKELARQKTQANYVKGTIS